MEYKVKEMHDGWIFRRGDIYLVSLDPVIGSEQGGDRPVVNLQNNTANFYSTLIWGLPVTSKIKRKDLPTHVMIGREGNLRKPSMVLVEQPKSLDKRRIIGYIGPLSSKTMDRITESVARHVGIIIPEEMEAP